MDKVQEMPGGAENGMPRQPFPAMLSQMRYAEQQLVQTLPKLIGEATDTELKVSLAQLLEQTHKHLTNAESIFEVLGSKPRSERAPVMDGLKEVHSELSSQTVSRAGRRGGRLGGRRHRTLRDRDVRIAPDHGPGAREPDGGEPAPGEPGPGKPVLEEAQKAIKKGSASHANDLAA